MANLEILALDTVVPQIRAPGVGDGYSAPRSITMALGTTFDAQAITAAGNVTLSGGTANQVQYLNAGKLLTGSSNLTFDGTTLTVNSLSLTGSGVFPAGTALLPSITTVGDLNTGIYFPAADTIGFSEGGVEAMRLNASGNLGVGTQSPNARLDVNGGDFWFGDTANTIRNIVFRRNGTTVGSISTVNQQFEVSGGATLNVGHLVITSGGNIGINTSSPLSGLHFNRAATGAVTPLASAVSRGFLITDSAATSATIQIGINGGSPTYIQARNNSGAGASALEILLNPLGGNVGIGISTLENLFQVSQRFSVDSTGVIRWGQDIRSATRQNSGLLTWDTNLVSIESVGAATAMRFSTNATPRLFISVTGLLQFAGTTNAFPALKRVSASLSVRLADDSADAALTASELTASTSTVNLSSIVSSGYSLTGSAAAPLMDLSGTWNTTGTPTGIKLNLTDTASDAASLLMDLEVGSVSQMVVTKNGFIGVGTATPAWPIVIERDAGSVYNDIQVINTSTQNVFDNQSRVRLSTAGDLVEGLAFGKTYNAGPYGGFAYMWNTEDTDTVFATNNTERLRVKNTGSVVVGTAALSASATDGFLYVPTCDGTPSGTPTSQTGTAPIVIDTTNNKLYFYSGGTWRDAGP